MVVWTAAVSVHSPDWLFWMNGFLLCTIFLTWQTSLLHPSSRAPSFKLLLEREALSSTIMSFVILSSSNLLLVVLSSPIELSTSRSSLMKSFMALFVKLVVLLSSIVCAHLSCSSFWAFWGHNPVKQLLHFVSVSCWLADLLIGPPTAFPLLGTGVPWVSLPGPTGVMTHPGRMMSHQRANPILLLCTGVLLHWLHSWRVHLQHYQTWPKLCTHLTTQEHQTKLRRVLTWLAWLENSIDLDTLPSAMRVHFRIHNRAAEVFSRSSTRSLRPVSVFLSLLVLWGSRGSWFASSPVPWLPSPCRGWTVRSSTWSSTCVCSSVSPCLDLTSSFWHWSRASWSSSSLFLDVLASNYTRVLWHAADFDFFAFRSWNFLIVNAWQIHCRGLLSQLSFFWMNLFFEDSLWFDYPFSALCFLLLHTFLSFQKPRFSEQCPFLLSLFFFWKEERNGVFSCFLFSPLHYDKLFSIENLCWLLLKLPHVFFFYSSLSLHLHQCNTFPFWASAFPFNSLLLFILFPLVLFFWSLRVFPFLSPFSPFWIFHWSWMSLCFLYR